MQKKVKDFSERITQWLKSWKGVKAISLADTADVDSFDPYFSLAMDIYCDGEIPSQEERQSWVFDQGGAAYESSRVNRKDRFLWQDLPVRIEYKETAHIESVLEGLATPKWLFKEKGTYLFYRLKRGHLLYDDEGWYAQALTALEDLPDSFWSMLRDTSQIKMEHYLSDLGAAVFREDRLYYYVSISGFLRGVCKTIFAVNKEFEPSPRMFTQKVTSLAILPPGFEANYNSLLREDRELDPGRKWEIAQLLAKGILDL